MTVESEGYIREETLFDQLREYHTRIRFYYEVTCPVSYCHLHPTLLTHRASFGGDLLSSSASDVLTINANSPFP